MDSAWGEGVYLGQRMVSNESLIGTKDGIVRVRSVNRVPKQKRWEDNLSYVCGLPWKHNERHEAGEEVVFGPTPPEPSFHPVTATLPPTYGT